jgi:hypothetical protein
MKYCIVYQSSNYEMGSLEIDVRTVLKRNRSNVPAQGLQAILDAANYVEVNAKTFASLPQ